MSATRVTTIRSEQYINLPNPPEVVTAKIDEAVREVLAEVTPDVAPLWRTFSVEVDDVEYIIGQREPSTVLVTVTLDVEEASR